jgi:hypothetical protein
MLMTEAIIIPCAVSASQFGQNLDDWQHGKKDSSNKQFDS